MVAFEDILLVQESVGELFLHVAFAQEEFDALFQYLFIQYLIDGWPLVRILVQHFADQAAELIRIAGGHGLELSPHNLHRQHVNISSVKRRLQRAHLVQKNTQ